MAQSREPTAIAERVSIDAKSGTALRSRPSIAPAVAYGHSVLSVPHWEAVTAACRGEAALLAAMKAAEDKPPVVRET